MSILRRKGTWIAAGAAVLLGVILAILDGTGLFWPGIFAYSLLLLLSVAGFAWASHLFQPNRAVQRAAWIAFGLRLGLGVALMLFLPLAGYQDSQASQAGYVFKDSFTRDTQAWSLAQSHDPVWAAFSGTYPGDQYGGMLALSAAIYRTLSPDAHRPFLVLIITAAAAFWGVLAAWAATKSLFGEQTAAAAAWIMALYPEAILLGASHMREGLVIPAIALAWYGVVGQKGNRLRGRLAVAAGLVILLLIQPAAALMALLVIIVFWILEPGRNFSWRWVGAFVVAFLVLLLIVYSIFASLPSLSGAKGWQVFSQWIENNFNLQTLITVRASGWMQNIIGDLGQQWKGVVVLAYGIFQPVLPAALVSPGASIWRVIGTLRGLGWYALAPLLIYNLVLVWRKIEEPRRAQLRWLAVAVWAWIIIASANGGGDQWDNPRYRAMFLAWQAVLAAWTWVYVRSHQERWFWRFVWIEAVFLVLFIYWYVGRKYVAVLVVDFWVIVILFGLISVGIIVGGWWRDRQRK